MAPSLPKFIRSGTYEKYKEDTSFIVEWLVETVSELGHDMSRYRKPANSASRDDSAVASRHRGASNLEFQIQTCDFLPLAEAIASSWPKALVSDAFMRRLRAALQARRVCALSYADTTDPDIEKDNQKHLYFMGVLQGVLDCLRPLHVQQRASQRSKNATLYRQVLPKNNVEAVTAGIESFEVVESDVSVSLEDDSAVQTERDPSTARTTMKSRVMFDEAAERKEEHRLFAIQCLLFDLHRLRFFVARRWVDYAQGRCDLVVVSVLMSMAVDFAMRLEDDLVKSLGLTNKHDVVLLSFLRSRMPYPNSEDFRAAVNQFDGLRQLEADLNEYTFMNEYLTAAQFLLEKKQGTHSACREELAQGDLEHPGTQQFGQTLWFRPSDSVPLLDLKLYKHQGPINFEISLSYTILIRAAFDASLDVGTDMAFLPNTHNMIDDCVLSRLRNACYQGDVDLSAAFALRLFYDSHQLLRNTISKPLSDLDERAIFLRMQARIYIAWLRKFGYADDEHFKGIFIIKRPSSGHRMVERVATNILEDICEQADTAWFFTQKKFRERLSQNPVATGLHKQWLECRSLQASLVEADDHATLVLFAHFYNAARVSGALTQPWRDMEHLIEIHTPEHLFLGGCPKPFEECLTRFRVSVRGTDVKLERLKNLYYRRKLAERLAPLSRILAGRAVMKFRPEHDHDLEDLELATRELKLRGTRQRIKLDDKGRIVNKADLRGWHRTSDNTDPLDFLTGVEAILKAELRMIRFDHIALERRCYVAVERMRDYMNQAGHDLRLKPKDRTKAGCVLLECDLIGMTLLMYEQELRAGIPVTNARTQRLAASRLREHKRKFDDAVKGLEIYLKENEVNGVKDLCADLVEDS